MPITSDTTLIELLQRLIRNACVNDGSPKSGQEHRNADTLQELLECFGLACDRVEPQPGRTSLIARLPGTDPQAHSLCLLGHTDVVPVDEPRWDRHPFGAEIVNDVIWGRGAIDMLNQTAAQAIALCRLAQDGFRGRGDLVLVAAADEEAGGTYGTAWIAEHEPELIRADYVITEGGGFWLPHLARATPPGSKAKGSNCEFSLAVMVAEKGPLWRRIHHVGTPGHASIPFHADNALAKAAETAQRICAYRSPARIDDIWHRLIDELCLPTNIAVALHDSETVDAALEDLVAEHSAEARILHACSHNTFSPNVMNAGTKVNVIPSRAVVTLDIRTLPNVTVADIDAELGCALGPLAGEVTIEDIATTPATTSPVDTPLWEALGAAVTDVIGEVRLVPWTTPFATDARFLRALGAVAYGVTLHDKTVDLAEWLCLAHGDNERVSIRSVTDAASFYEHVARRVLA